MFLAPEAASPAQSTDVLIGIAGWRRWVGLRSGPTSGGYCLVPQGLLSAAHISTLYKPSVGAFAGLILSDKFDTAYRDVSD